MLSIIEYALPDNGNESRSAFAALQNLLGSDGSVVRLSPDANLKPETIFRLDEMRSKASIVLKMPTEKFEFPTSFFPEQSTVLVKLPFTEAARRLTGEIQKVDHTGFIVPVTTASNDWEAAINFLAQNAVVYDYPPATDGYDTQTARWLFTIPASEQEGSGGITNKQLRQPKFEIVWDADNPGAVVQIDMETKLTREKIIDLFPNDESFDIPGLEPFFRSVNVKSPWDGIRNIRFDLRYAASNPQEVTPWNSADFFVQEGKRVIASSAATQLPKRTLG